MKLKDAFKKVFDRETEMDAKIEQRKAVAQLVATALSGVRIGDDPVAVRLVQNDEVGPLGGVSDRITIQIGADRKTANYVYISVYANGVMAE